MKIRERNGKNLLQLILKTHDDFDSKSEAQLQKSEEDE